MQSTTMNSSSQWSKKGYEPLIQKLKESTLVAKTEEWETKVEQLISHALDLRSQGTAGYFSRKKTNLLFSFHLTKESLFLHLKEQQGLPEEAFLHRPKKIRFAWEVLRGECYLRISKGKAESTVFAEELKAVEEIQELIKEEEKPPLLARCTILHAKEKSYLYSKRALGDCWNEIDLIYSLSLAEKEKLAMSLLTSVAFLHRHHIYHLDIKPENILLYKEENEGDNYYQVELIDFADSSKKESLRKADPCRGTIEIMPFEMKKQLTQKFGQSALIQSKPIESKPIDLWELGLTLYFLFHATFPPPLPSKNFFHNLERQKKCFHSWLEQEKMKDERERWILDLLNLDPNQRPNAKELLQSLTSGQNPNEC